MPYYSKHQNYTYAKIGNFVKNERNNRGIFVKNERNNGAVFVKNERKDVSSTFPILSNL